MNKYLDIVRKLKKLWNMKMTVIPIEIGALGTKSKGFIRGLEELELGGCAGTMQNYNIDKIGRNTERSPGNLWRLAVTKNPVKDYQLMLVRKTRKEL